MTDSELLRVAHTLLCVVALMDEDERPGAVKVHLDSMPSLAPLFTVIDGRALYLTEAVRRFVDIIMAPDKVATHDADATNGGAK